MNSALKPHQNNQKGIVSILITMVMILVISLIILGLSQVSRRQLRQATDTQLSTQAFYAAESGVNDAAAKLAALAGAGAVIPSKTTCENTLAPPYNSFKTVINSASNVSYSCLLIDPSPPVLTATLSAESQVLAITPENHAPVDSIKLKWTKPDGIPGTYHSCPSGTTSVFTPASSWACPYGVLRIDLVDTSNGVSRDSLLNKTMNVFVVPTRANGGGNAHTPFRTGASAHIANGCTSSCELTITGLTSNQYYLRATEIYRSGGELSVSIAGNRGLIGSQAIVDVTGKAQDVLRRVRVFIDINGDNKNRAATGGIMSGESICKQFYTLPGNTYSNPC